MCDCSVDTPSIYEEVKRRARKQHKCSECGWTIEPASQYVKISGLWDGEWTHSKQCLSCNEIGDRFVQETDCCYAIGQLYSELQDSEILDYDRETKTWASKVDWLKIASQSPLKCVGLQKDEHWVEFTKCAGGIA
jgi:hypothetical protein